MRQNLSSNIGNVNFNININYDKNIFTVRECFRYSIRDNICVVDFGGITSKKAGSELIISSEMPKAKSRAVCLLMDGTVALAPSPESTLAYNALNSTILYVHIRDNLVNKALYGQMIYFI